jgi:outer membrane lipase/esterase
VTTRRALLAVTLTIPFAGTLRASALRRYSKLVVFGDGLCDQGRFGALTNFRYPPSPPFDRGRWTGGPTWVEHLARLSGLPLSPADNHAIGGATTGRYNINEPMRASLGIPSTVPIPGVLAQIEAAVAVGRIDARALYVVWAGGHDIGAWLENGQPDIKAHPPHENIREGLQLLRKAGTRHVFLGTMPDMGATPAYAGTEKAAKATDATNIYNAGLTQVAEAMRHHGMSVVLFDGAAAFGRVFAEARQRGITVFDEAYLPFDFIDFANPLAAPRAVPANRNSNAYFNFWAVSAGPKVHEALGEYAFETLQTAT